MVSMSSKGVPFSVQPIFWIVVVFAVILLPLPWVVGWLLAVTLHELGHILGIVFFRIPVCAVQVKVSGVYIQTAQMSLFQGVVVAAMGPLVGGIPTVLSQWLPHTAICAMVLFVFNMLPIADFDGGRVLYGILRMFLSPAASKQCMIVIHTAILFICILATVYTRWNILAISLTAVLLLRIIPVTFPCKHRKQIVQWSKRKPKRNIL